MGCGDGKNLLYLERRGWTVDAVDVSELEIKGLISRLRYAQHSRRGRIFCEDVLDSEFEEEAYDLVIVYGLYHCINQQKLEFVHRKVINALKGGGLLAFASFNDTLMIPPNHHTGPIYLRPVEHIFSILRSWNVVAKEIGVVRETHLPLVGEHIHGLTWALFEKGEN